jgi:cation diffusion facilitator CzcD-associated flavoprotein CzcO
LVEYESRAAQARLGRRRSAAIKPNARTSTTDMSADLEVAIIGAGPYGLSCAVHLRRAGCRPQVFGEPMSFWRTMPAGMKLRSNWSATNMVEPVGPLSMKSYIAETGDRFESPVPLRRFIAYGRWVQGAGVPDLDRRTVARLEHAPRGFVLTLGDGERVSARRVVVAGGIAPFERQPPGFDHLPSRLVSHTGRHRDMSAFAGRRVVVVGSGQSAFECAVLMHERGAEVEVIARGDSVVWLRSYSPKILLGPLGDLVYAPTDVGPLWYSRLVAAPDVFRRLPRETQIKIAYRSIRPACSYFVKVRLDEVKLTLDTEVRGAQEHGDALRLSLSDGTSREVDHLTFGTGYRVDVARYPFLAPSILAGLRRVDGYPLLRRGLESSVPGLHIVGAPAAWSFGPTLRFVSGSWYAGRALARAIGGGWRPGRARALAKA